MKWFYIFTLSFFSFVVKQRVFENVGFRSWKLWLMTEVHIFITYLSKFHFNTILTSTPRFPKYPHTVSLKNAYVLFPQYKLLAPPTQLPYSLFKRLNNVMWNSYYEGLRLSLPIPPSSTLSSDSFSRSASVSVTEIYVPMRTPQISLTVNEYLELSALQRAINAGV